MEPGNLEGPSMHTVPQPNMVVGDSSVHSRTHCSVPGLGECGEGEGVLVLVLVLVGKSLSVSGEVSGMRLVGEEEVGEGRLCQEGWKEAGLTSSPVPFFL